MHNTEIRKKILETLYHEFQKEGIASSLGAYSIAREIGIDENDMEFNYQYLEGRGFIKLMKFGSPETGVFLIITPKGIDLVEGPSEFNPPHENKSQCIEIKEIIVGQVIQADLSPINISLFFGHLIQSIQNHPGLQPDEKTHIGGLVLKSIHLVLPLLPKS